VTEALPVPILSVVIPVYREGTHLSATLQEIVAILKDSTGSFEIVLVDDGSPDDTWDTILQQKDRFEQVQGVRLSRHFGKEAALAAGLEFTSGSAILVMDGDLQHPPTLIPEMIQLWRNGGEVVEAVKRSREKETFIMRVSARLFYSIFTRLTEVDLHGASDFKLMDRRVLDAWQKLGEHSLFFRGMSAWLGFRRVQLPFDVPDRSSGQTGWSLLQRIKLAMTAVTSFSSAPLYLIILLAMGFAAFAFVLGLQALYYKFTGHAVDGSTTVILLILILGSVVLFGLGLIGVYIAQIYDEVKGRPRYIIAEHLK
jgi:glycosyltransferase involved in cell wall biosynthesis